MTKGAMPTVVELPASAEVVQGESVELGQWYWVKTDGDDEAWFGCVTRIGSNYVKITSVEEGSMRIHADRFFDWCRMEGEPSKVIEGNAARAREEVQDLMLKVEALTARLGVGRTAGAIGPGGSSSHALAKLGSGESVEGYKTALVRAKEEELPELFKQIEESSAELAMWMKAETLPSRARLEEMKGAIGVIEDRIFNVELYAGLTEEVVRVADGEPAPMAEKIRLMQRRCYMDEECLARYEVGGMEFDDIVDFDAWLARTENRDRILPFPRCVVAFRVRRHMKDRPIFSLISLLDAMSRELRDKLTFLYLRNGDQLYRMNTKLDFGEELFPDSEHHSLMSGSKLWANTSGTRVGKIITDEQYQGLLEDYAAKRAKHKEEVSAYRRDLKAWKAAKKAAEAAGQDFNESRPWEPHFWERSPKGEYEPYEPNNIHYDDIQEKIDKEIKQYNRVGIIIQGLLDRSPVFHPHPPWKIWSEGGFDVAIELVHDATRALVGGEKPDFEAYRARLNETLAVGSVTVGHRAMWSHEQREKGRKSFYGDPGPGMLARVETYRPRKGQCTYAWNRLGTSRGNWDKKIRAVFTCDARHVLNVDAYTPGDFRIFFEDARTRAEYLRWAPLLLEAEEYHAGNRKVEDPPPKEERVRTLAGSAAYQRRKRLKGLVGKTVRLTREITTRGGDTYPEGSLWQVSSVWRGELSLRQIGGDGGLRCIDEWDVRVVSRDAGAS